MNRVLDENTPGVTRLVEVIASRAAGWGSAFRELLKLANLTQAALAREMEISDTTISHWVAERHKPSYEVLRRSMLLMHVDVRLVQQYFGGEIVPSAPTSKAAAALKVAEIVLLMKDADLEALESKLHTELDGVILASMAAKALAGDVRAAATFLQRGQAQRSQRRRKYTPAESEGANAQTVNGECAAVPGRII